MNGLKSRELLLRNRSDAVDLRPTPVGVSGRGGEAERIEESLTIEIGWKAQQPLASRDDLQIRRRDN